VVLPIRACETAERKYNSFIIIGGHDGGGKIFYCRRRVNEKNENSQNPNRRARQKPEFDFNATHCAIHCGI